ncbi:2OG-Fe(II) oxygenase family protein [Sphingomonas koreensis]
MSSHMIISQEIGKRITATDECVLVKAAYARNPESPVLRARLGTLFNLCDAFDETIALYAAAGADTLTYTEAMLLGQAHIAQENDADTHRARAAAGIALMRADSDAQRASALALEGKALVRLGDFAAAEERLTRALDLDPHSKDACKRLAALLLDRDDTGAVLAMTDRLLTQGAGHSRLFAARALAFARRGEIDAARAMAGWDLLARRTMLTPPPGWDSLDAFNAALAQELLTHPGMRFDRYGAASEQTWRIDSPATGEAPLVRALLAQIEKAVDAHGRDLAAIRHPWVDARPERGTLHCWSVITESTGFETWHVHQFGWLSGVYYVQIPDSIAQGEGEGGCIAFGLPEDVAGDEAAAAFGQHLERPSAGTLMMFPSHNYHRTFPHGLAERRICFAFDIWPD